MYESLPPIEITPRKRPANVSLNITPVKKILIEPVGEDDESDEDFTERFIKHTEPKEKPKPVEEKEKEKEVVEVQKKEERVEKEEVKKVEKDRTKKEEHSRTEKVSETSRRTNYDRGDRRSGEKSRERSRRDVRDRRRSPERRRQDYSRERDVRARRRSKERERIPIRRRSRDRDRNRERDRNRDVDRDDKYFRPRRFSRSPTPKKIFEDRLYQKSPPPIHPDDTNFSMTSMDIVQSPINSPMDGLKRSLADSTISDSELSKRQDDIDNSPRYPAPVRLPARIESPSSPKRISLDDRINLVLGIEKDPPKPIGTVCTRGQYDTGHQPAYQETYQYGRADYDNYPPPQTDYGSHYYQNYQQYPQHPRTESNIKVVQVGNVIQVVPTEQPPPPPKPALPKVNVSRKKIVKVA